MDPEHTRKSAGVGFLHRDGIDLIPIIPNTKDYTDAYDTGRAIIMQLEITTGYLYLADIYGWTGGNPGSIAAGRTNDILTILLNELDLQDEGPSIIGGDINGDPSSFPVLQRYLDADEWHDVGNLEQFAGLDIAQPTCQARIGGRETRRDYFLVNAACLDIVQSLEVVTLSWNHYP